MTEPADRYTAKVQPVGAVISADEGAYSRELIARNLIFYERTRRDLCTSVCVVIPAKDEAHAVGEIVSLCAAYADRVLVVDGRSKDGSLKIAEEAGAEVLVDDGRGKGSALRLALTHVREDVTVFVDADGSHNPHDIPRLVLPIATGEADHVHGSRTMGGSDEAQGDLEMFLRLMGSALITLCINLRFGTRLTESQNGLRAIRTRVARALDLEENITTIEQEMVIKSLRKGFTIHEVPTFELARSGGRSKIRLHRVAFRYVVSLLKYLFF